MGHTGTYMVVHYIVTLFYMWKWFPAWSKEFHNRWPEISGHPYRSTVQTSVWVRYCKQLCVSSPYITWLSQTFVTQDNFSDTRRVGNIKVAPKIDDQLWLAETVPMEILMKQFYWLKFTSPSAITFNFQWRQS